MLWNIYNCHLLFLFFRNLPPSQGGKYVGFGSTPMSDKKDDDFFDNTLSSLSSVSLLIFKYFIEARCKIKTKLLFAHIIMVKY